MPKKEINTGIFTRTEYENLTASEKKQWAEAAKNFDVRAYLKEMDTMAREKLRGVVTDFTPGKYKCSITKEEWDAEPLYIDCMDLTNDITLVLYLMDKGDIENAVFYALRAGMVMLRIEVRSHEKSAVTGRKTREFLAKGREIRGKKVASKHSKIIELFKELKAQYEPHERPSDTQIMHDMSKNLGLKFKTVESVLYRASHKSAK